MKLSIGNLKTYLAQGSKRDEDWLASYLTFRSGSEQHARPATMFSSMDRSFPTGLLDLVLKQAKADLLYVELEDARTPRPPPDRTYDLSWLYDHQREAVEALLVAGAGVVQHATGAGKTGIMHGLLGLYQRHKATVLVPSKGLLGQFAKEYRRRLGRECGVVGSGKWEPAQHTVATYQTLYEDLQRAQPRYDYAGQEILLIDETQGAAAATFWEVAMAFRNTFLRGGFSATAFDRLDKKGLYVRSATGPVVSELTPGEAVERGIIAKPTIVMAPYAQPPIAGHISTMRTQSITGSSGRNLLILRHVLELPKPCLVFVREIPHGELLAAMIGRSVPTVFVHGELSDATIEARKALLISGAAKVMVASAVMNQGIDIPSIASTLNAAGGMSVISTLQKIGRGTRIVRDTAGKVTKNSVRCIDVADIDCGCKGQTHASCAMFLRWAGARRTAYLKAGYLVEG